MVGWLVGLLVGQACEAAAREGGSCSYTAAACTGAATLVAATCTGTASGGALPPLSPSPFLLHPDCTRCEHATHASICNECDR